MICDICGENNAIVVVQKITNNIKHQLHLCLNCATERGLAAKNGKLEMSLAGLFEDVAASKKFDRVCPVCGCRLSQIKKTLNLGCPECYSIFTSEIQIFLKEQGVIGSYTGSVPRRLANFKSVLTDRMMLRSKLDESIAREDYEKAAIYRDRLKALEKCAVADGEAEFNGEQS
ncbi:MAG: UvrB/UvrC motif-containing protein [Spirochaetaceae bacterium]|nr:UvrB/UvrC motif-containing protein [Spirochaetaceae bacterium]